MTDKVTGVHGEYRPLTALEVGLLIRMVRDQQRIKRAVLAASANVSEKTVERAEAGSGISEECRRRIACALGMKEGALTEPLFIPTPEEFERMQQQGLEELKRTHRSQPVQEITGVRDVLSLFGQCALFADNSNVEEDDLGAFAEFQQLLSDWSDIASDIPAPGRVEAAREVLDSIRGFEARGYQVKWAVTDQYRVGGEAPFPCAVVVAFKAGAGRARPPDAVWLPRRAALGM
jgi:hypothetical protein